MYNWLIIVNILVNHDSDHSSYVWIVVLVDNSIQLQDFITINSGEYKIWTYETNLASQHLVWITTLWLDRLFRVGTSKCGSSDPWTSGPKIEFPKNLPTASPAPPEEPAPATAAAALRMALPRQEPQELGPGRGPATEEDGTTWGHARRSWWWKKYAKPCIHH